MTKEELELRIEKKENQIAKVEKRIAKWSKGMPQEAIDLCSACELIYTNPDYKEKYNEWKKFKDDNYYTPLKDKLYNPDNWHKGPNYDELRLAYNDLAEQKETLNKYQTKLNELINFENENKIEVIWNFLQEIREMNYNYFIENSKLYINLKDNEKNEFEKYSNEHKELFLNNRNSYYTEENWKKYYYRNVHSITKSLTHYSSYRKEFDIEELNKILDDDIKAKYKDLVYRITEKAGQILNASNLHTNNGNINGTVIGSKNKVHVETIGAGGYNIQCFHYRTLVHVIK